MQTHTHTRLLPSDLRQYVTARLPLRSQGGRAEVNQWANRICDMLSCPCVALKGFVGLGSKLSKPTKWVARCREELLRFTRQDSLYGFYFFTLCHAPGKPWASTELRHVKHIETHKHTSSSHTLYSVNNELKLLKKNIIAFISISFCKSTILCLIWQQHYVICANIMLKGMQDIFHQDILDIQYVKKMALFHSLNFFVKP